MNSMSYKGYTARIEYSDEDGCFVGHLAGIDDVVGFHGSDVDELCAAFHDAVDDYLDTCEQLGRVAETAAGDRLTLWVPTDVREAVACAAETSGKSIDNWAAEALAAAARR